MFTYFATLLPLIFILITGLRFRRISSFLLLFISLSSLLSLIFTDSFIPIAVSLFLVILLLFFKRSRDNLFRMNMLLVSITAITSLYYSPAALIILIAALFRKELKSAAAASSAAALLTAYLVRIYYLDTLLATIILCLLTLFGVLLNREKRTLSKAE